MSIVEQGPDAKTNGNDRQNDDHDVTVTIELQPADRLARRLSLADRRGRLLRPPRQVSPSERPTQRP